MTWIPLSGALDRAQFTRHEIPVPTALSTATVELVPARSRKWHTPDGCQHGRGRDTDAVLLLEVRWDDLCRNCTGPTVDPVHAAALHAVAALTAMCEDIDRLSNALDTTEGTLGWLDYARYRARRTIAAESLPELTTGVRGVRGWARVTAAVNRAGLAYSRRYDELLDRRPIASAPTVRTGSSIAPSISWRPTPLPAPRAICSRRSPTPRTPTAPTSGPAAASTPGPS